jgi:hypothetical protein
MATSEAPADRPAPRPRRPRRRDIVEEGGVFGSFTPWKNPPAVYAYTVALIGMTPVLGLVLGPVAVGFGLAGLVRFRRDPEVKGASFVRAGIVIGALDFVVNAAGLACIAKGLGWL